MDEKTSSRTMTPPPIPSSLPSPTSTIAPLDEEKGTTETDIGPPPDGGATAWLCVMSTFMLLFCIFGIGESLPNT